MPSLKRLTAEVPNGRRVTRVGPVILVTDRLNHTGEEVVLPPFPDHRFGVDELDRSLEIADVASVQNRYSLEDRGSEDVLRRCAERGIGFIPWFPLAAGRLTGDRRPLTEVARAHRATPAQIALAWLLARSSVMLPIPGTSKVEHLEENVAAATIQLADEEIELLSRAVG